MMNGDISVGEEKVTKGTEAADRSIDDVGRILIRDLHHQFGDETDPRYPEGKDQDHLYQDEIGHGRRFQEEIDRAHIVQEQQDQSHHLGDEIALRRPLDGDHHHQKSVEEADQIDQCKHEEETHHLLTPDQHLLNDEDLPIDELRIQHGTTEIMGTVMEMEMDATMITDETELAVAMIVEKIEDHSQALARRK